jgi:hypothetical protein
MQAGRKSREHALRGSRLSRNVAREYRRMQRQPVHQRAAEWMRDRVAAPTSLPGAVALPLATLAVTVAVLFIPSRLGFRALADPADARNFLSQMWQVSGASVGLSVAVVVFAFQGAASGRLATALRDYAVRAPLLIVVYLGVSALVVDALVLLGVGYSAPAGWAASWAADVSALSVVSVAFLFAAALRSIDPQVLYGRRMAAIRRQAALAVRQEARLRIGVNLMRLDAAKHCYEFSLFASPGGGEVIRAHGAGEVRDIKLRRLHALAKACSDPGGGKLVVAAYPGRELTSNGIIMVIPPGTAAVRKPGGAVVIRTPRWQPKADLEHNAQQLHEDATRAINDSSLLSYGMARDAQAELLLSLPRMWHLLGQQFSSEIASGFSLTGQSPANVVCRNLYEQAARAAGKGEREIALEAGYVPVDVAWHALELGAPGLGAQMMGLLRSMASMAPESGVSRLVREHVLLNLSTYLEAMVGPRLTESSRAEDARLEAEAFLEQGLNAVADMAKDAVERRDVDFFREADRQLHQVLGWWLCDEAKPYRPDSLSKRLAQKAGSARAQLHFCLGAWVLRRLWEQPQDDVLAAMLQTVLGSYPAADRALRAARLVQGRDRLGKLSEWSVSEMTPGAAQVIDSATPLYRFAALVLLREGCAGSYRIEENSWLEGASDALLHEMDDLVSAPQIWAAAGPGCDPVAARTAAAAALSEAVVRQREKDEQELISAAVTDQAREAFRDGVKKGWDANRKAATVLRAAGSPAHPDDDARPATRIGLPPLLIGKEIAVRGDYETGLKSFGEDLGKRLGSAESEQIYRLLGQSPVIVPAASQDLPGHVVHALAQMRGEGYDPKLLIVGDDWKVTADLPVQPLPKDSLATGSAPGVLGVLGQFEGILVMRAAGLPADWAVLVDPSRWDGSHEWAGPRGDAIEARLDGFTEAEAADLAEQDPLLYAGIADPTPANRAVEIRKHAAAEAAAHVEVRAGDVRAARRLSRP